MDPTSDLDPIIYSDSRPLSPPPTPRRRNRYSQPRDHSHPHVSLDPRHQTISSSLEHAYISCALSCCARRKPSLRRQEAFCDKSTCKPLAVRDSARIPVRSGIRSRRTYQDGDSEDNDGRPSKRIRAGTEGNDRYRALGSGGGLGVRGLITPDPSDTEENTDTEDDTEDEDTSLPPTTKTPLTSSRSLYNHLAETAHAPVARSDDNTRIRREEEAIHTRSGHYYMRKTSGNTSAGVMRFPGACSPIIPPTRAAWVALGADDS